MEKSYRIHTNTVSDTVLNVNMTQDYDFLEVLSLKLRTSDAYRLHSSSYGVIIGRVLANDAFGIPNARISVFIPRDANDSTYTEAIYPYTEVMDTDREGRRYNLLPDDSSDECYRIVGTFPNKRLVLDDDVTLDIYDKYYKFTTVTNSAGDYMLFGVPSGNQQIHVDMDLSDIGLLSQTPRDFEHKGYNIGMFDSPAQFKESTNLDSLAQIFSQNKSTFVYPFWGDTSSEDNTVAITRCDVQIQYKFEPTCVFMGAIFSDNEGNSIGHKCAANVDNGMNDQLVTGEGTIEMIRKTTDGLVEEFSIQGNQLIDANGVWCYQIPMNLDYVATDEYGNIVPTDNPNKGIPTRTQVRFRFSKSETGNEGHSRHTAKYLVPMNPTLVENKPKTAENGAYIEKMYSFGSNTPDDCFRDLYWNNVYSVKNYIPKLQIASRAYTSNYTGLKGSNLAKDQNPIPFNKIRIDIPVMYIIVCIIFRIVILIVQFINIVISMINKVLMIFERIRSIRIPIIGVRPFAWLPSLCCIGCVSLGGGLSPDNTAFYPSCGHEGMEAASCPDDMENCRKSASPSRLTDLVQQKLAEDFKIVKLDFYQDWMNGSLYMPLWYWRVSKKKKYLFNKEVKAKNDFCDCDKVYSRLKSYVTCNIVYNNKNLGVSDSSLPEGENNWHRSSNRSGLVRVPYGIIKQVENKDGLNVYYYSAIQPTSEAGIIPMKNRGQFLAFRTFATDIILLGNLNENNLYGLPQFFKSLPSTTANIPPIASIEDAADDGTGGPKSENVLADEGESGPSLVTGMDWIDGDGTPAYSDGLFFLLSCTYAHTKAKTCINVERLSELGMNLDMNYDTTYPSPSGLRVGSFEHDGLITKYELDDTDNRAMFATMNHLGFVPQTYQETKVGEKFNETQVLDENTNYYVPKFKYLYPTDLDGRMQPIVERYRNGFEQIMSDDADSAYINFRLGDTQGKNRRSGGQFYVGNSMPLYNNSFYFYFGIKKGNTAIEKFNKMFTAQCFKNSKSPFTLNITTRPKSACPQIYKTDEDGYSYGDSMIHVVSDDIQIPYQYELIDSNGIEVVGPVLDVMQKEFKIHSINNGMYTLKVTDVNGRSVIERLNIEYEEISISYYTRGLGTKFYFENDSESEVKPTTFDDICNDHELYGKVTFDGMFIDGHEFEIGTGTTMLLTTPDEAIMEVYAKAIEENSDIFNDYGDAGVLIGDFRITLKDTSRGDRMYQCLCYNMGTSGSFFTGYTAPDIFGKTKFIFGLDIWKPYTYIGELTMLCNNTEVSANSNTMAITIANGNNFNAYLNKVPIKFLETAFYPAPTVNDIIVRDESTGKYVPNTYGQMNTWFKKWMSVNGEKDYNGMPIYTFPSYNERVLWKEYVPSLNDNFLDSFNKKKIIEYKFSSIFNLSRGVYVTNYGGNKFTYTADGGVQPLLYRSFAPYYSDTKNLTKNFKYSENNYVTVDPSYPNIVGSNYKDNADKDISALTRTNQLFEVRDNDHVGNYFMAATNNGRYVNNYDGDCSIYSVQAPTDAAVNLITDDWKKIGYDMMLQKIPKTVYEGASGDNIPLCQPNAQPHFRAMFVDRRLDYDLAVIGGFMDVPQEFGDVPEISYSAIERVRTVRILGTIFNGIEMGYDDDYNIIDAKVHRVSAETEDSGDTETINWISSAESVTQSNTLEYTYQYGSGDSKYRYVATVLNDYEGTYCIKNYGDKANQLICQWIKGHYYDGSHMIYDPNGENKYPVLKTMYSARIGNVDLRQLMWSRENSAILGNLANSPYNNWNRYNASGTSLGTLPFYIYQHDNEFNIVDKDTLEERYNGLFGHRYNYHYTDEYGIDHPITKLAYPTKRYIDIGKIEPKTMMEFNLTSCSYDVSLELDEETDLFKSYINLGDSLDIDLNLTSIKPSPRSRGEEYGHFVYFIQFDNLVEGGGVYSHDNTFGTTKTASISDICIGMNYKQVLYENLKGYEYPMRLLTWNELKTLNDKDTEEEIKAYWDSLPKFGCVTVNGAIKIRQEGNKSEACFERENETFLSEYPYSINHDDNDRIYYGNEALFSNDEMLYDCRICITRDGWEQGGDMYENSAGDCNIMQYGGFLCYGGTDRQNYYANAMFVTVCGLRELISDIEDNSTKRIHVFEFSDFYDIRKIKVTGFLECKSHTPKFKIVLHEYDSGNTSEDSTQNKQITFDNIVDYEVMILGEENYDSLSHYPSSHYPWKFFVDKKKMKEMEYNAAAKTITFELDGSEGYELVRVDRDKNQRNYYARSLYLYLTMENGAIYKIVVGEFNLYPGSYGQAV